MLCGEERGQVDPVGHLEQIKASFSKADFAVSSATGLSDTRWNSNFNP